LVSKMLDIWQMIRAWVTSRDIPQDFCPCRALQKIERNTKFFHQYLRQSDKRGSSTQWWCISIMFFLSFSPISQVCMDNVFSLWLNFFLG
jgi:hypothetical protein